MKIIKKIIAFFSLGSLLPLFFTMMMVVVIAAAVSGSSSSDDDTGGIEISELGEKEIPAHYIPIYKEAGEKYNIAWTLIAAFHKVETNFGTSETMVSSAGAIGHFQFLPETWLGWSYGPNPPANVYRNPAMIARHGGYGVDADGDGIADPYNIKDSAFANANYVSASGGMDNLHDAIYAYNHAEWYVDRVMSYYKMYTNGDYTTSNGGGNGGGNGFIIPVDNPKISSGFVDRINPVTGQAESHKGLDFAQPMGSKIKAAKDGVVVISQYNGAPVSGYGKCIIIQHNDGTWTLYAHQSELFVHKGQAVKQGQVIGLVGSTGESTGPHLHLEIRKQFLGGQVDPAKILGLN